MHPLSFTLRVIIIDPEVLQLTRYGPEPLPVIIVPPEKSQSYVAVVPAVPENSIADASSGQTGEVTVNVEVGAGVTSTMIVACVPIHPGSVTVNVTVKVPAEFHVTLWGPPPEPGFAVPPLKSHVKVVPVT